MKTRIAILLAFLFKSTLSFAEKPDCSNTTLPNAKDVALYFNSKIDTDDKDYGNLCKINILAIHPTQFVVGMHAVKQKIEKVKERKNDDELKDFLKHNPQPIVIGPNGKYYIIDHHHLARALAVIDQNSHSYGIILENHFNVRRKQSMEKFWEYLSGKEWAYFGDAAGKIQKPEDLEKTVNNVMEMTDDPFRSLAGEVRCDKKCAADGSDGFVKAHIPFEEFKWANHFRKMNEFKGMHQGQMAHYKKLAIAEIVRLKGRLPEDER